MLKKNDSIEWPPQNTQYVIITILITLVGFGIWLGWTIKPETSSSLTTTNSAQNTQLKPSGLGPVGFIRTTEKSKTAQAARLTLLNQWNFLNQTRTPILLKDFREMTINLSSFNMSLLDRLDYPALITWRAKEKSTITTAVLFSLNVNAAIILDPLYGVQQIPRNQLPKHILGDTTILWRPFLSLPPNQQNDDSAQLHQTILKFLEQARFVDPKDIGQERTRVTHGIQKLQKFYGLEPTGSFTTEVHLILAKELRGEQVPSLLLPATLLSSSRNRESASVP